MHPVLENYHPFLVFMQPYLESEHTILEISYPISKSKKNKPAAQEKAHLQTAPPAPKPTSAKELFLPLFPLRQKRINFPPLLLHICNSLNKKALHITSVTVAQPEDRLKQ